MAYLKQILGVIGAILVVVGLQSGVKNASQQVLAKSETALRQSSKLTQNSPSNSTTKPRIIENYYADRLRDLGIRLRPGTEHRKDSRETPVQGRRCKSAVYRTLIKLPSTHRLQLQDLVLYYTADGRRGLGGNGTIILRCNNISDSELSAVLIHEVGHLVDSTLLYGGSGESGFMDFDQPVGLDDPSLNFYEISWDSDRARRRGISKLDFVSQYAMNDPFEDFAETYTYYRLHGAEFRLLAESNSRLNAKYEFMRNQVFYGEEFGFNEKTNINAKTRDYDVTVLAYSPL